MQAWIYKRSLKICKRDLSVQFFDCTNYYFDIGRPDVDLLDDKGNVVDEKGNRAKAKYRKRGSEKNRRPDPIVGMGFPVGTIIESLRNYGCVRLDANNYQFIRYDDVIEACSSGLLFNDSPEANQPTKASVADKKNPFRYTEESAFCPWLWALRRFCFQT